MYALYIFLEPLINTEFSYVLPHFMLQLTLNSAWLGECIIISTFLFIILNMHFFVCAIKLNSGLPSCTCFRSKFSALLAVNLHVG